MSIHNDDFDRFFLMAREEHLPGYDWRLLKAQGYQESQFDPAAVSPVGAMGVMQFMPATWEDQVSKGKASGDPFNPEDSINAGAVYMAQLIATWKAKRPELDRHCLAMASYNAGTGNLLKAQKKVGGKSLYINIISGLPDVTGQNNSHETITYVKRILGYWAQLVTG